jgi:hypothetical protein
MLFFVSSILQNKNRKKLQRRAAIMPRQMQLWATPKESPQSQKIWRNLEHQLQKDVIAALANLICKMVLSQDANQSQEESHER